MELGTIHRLAIAAIVVLAITWSEGSERGLVISRGLSFTLVIAYLIYVLVALIRRRDRSGVVVDVGDPSLWDRDLDG